MSAHTNSHLVSIATTTFALGMFCYVSSQGVARTSFVSAFVSLPYLITGSSSQSLLLFELRKLSRGERMSS